MSHRLVQSHHVRGDDLNAKIAVAITRGVGTMWAAYVFAVIAIAALFFTPLVWFSTAFLQLVLLPIIIVGQNVISRAQDARAEADHDTLVTLHQINEHQLELLDVLHKLGAATHDEASTARRAIDVVGDRVNRDAALSQALQAYEESHARYEEISINGHPVRNRIPDGCPLCTQAREVLHG